jgi:hypothetical protein
MAIATPAWRKIHPGDRIQWDGVWFYVENSAGRWLYQNRRKTVFAVPTPPDWALTVQALLLYADANQRTFIGTAKREKMRRPATTEEDEGAE